MPSKTEVVCMKTIGLLGGMSWESTVTYYRIINEEINRRLGGHHSARLSLFSVDFDEIEILQHREDWDGTAEILGAAAERVERGSADFLLICTNTMHKIAGEIGARIRIPIVHIADATAEAIVSRGVKTVGLMGTRFTMEDNFYKGRLEVKYGLEVLIPEKEDRELIHRVIYDELCLGKIRGTSRENFLAIIQELHERGAQGVILGCTEISLLVGQEDTNVPLFDTTEIHALKAVEMALAE